MFTKKPEVVPFSDQPKPFASLPPLSAAAPSSPSPSSPPPMNTLSATSAPSQSSSVIGTDLSVVGNLESKGEIQIEGNVQGDIQASRIVVGANARITGSLVADDIIVQGTVMGSVRGNRVTLQSSSKVEGDVFHQSLAIEQGAYFEGKSRRSDNPKDGAKAGSVAQVGANGYDSASGYSTPN